MYILDVEDSTLKQITDCTSYDTVTSVTGGRVLRNDSTICAWGDGLDYTASFEPFSIVEPTCLDDNSKIWKYKITYPGGVDLSKVYVSIDPELNTIRVVMLPDASTTAEGTIFSGFTVTAQLPNGQSWDFPMNIKVS